MTSTSVEPVRAPTTRDLTDPATVIGGDDYATVTTGPVEEAVAASDLAWRRPQPTDVMGHTPHLVPSIRAEGQVRRRAPRQRVRPG